MCLCRCMYVNDLFYVSLSFPFTLNFLRLLVCSLLLLLDEYLLFRLHVCLTLLALHVFVGNVCLRIEMCLAAFKRFIHIWMSGVSINGIYVSDYHPWLCLFTYEHSRVCSCVYTYVSVSSERAEQCFYYQHLCSEVGVYFTVSTLMFASISPWLCNLK